MLAIYLTGYGLVRFFIEYARQPDAQLGFIVLSLSMGQLPLHGHDPLPVVCYWSILKKHPGIQP